MNQFETAKIGVGIFLGLLLTGCTQFQNSVANPGSSSLSTDGTGNTSLSSNSPEIQRAGLATTAAQISQDISNAIQQFSPTSGSVSCDLSGSCTFAIAPQVQSTFMNLSSASFADYRGETMGGGYEFAISVINQTASFSEPGIHLVNTSSSPFDFSSRTVTPLAASFNALDTSLLLNGGALELIDNTNQYVASLTADNLAFDSSCKCPVSGSLSGNLSGAFSGSIFLTFNSCGSITITAAGNSSTATVSSCQL